MKTDVQANCPNCGHAAYMEYDEFAPPSEIVDCDKCKKPFAVKVEMIARVLVSKVTWKKQPGEQYL